jgi:tripartite-type tricarboxylate transporter receptor subunit TctC
MMTAIAAEYPERPIRIIVTTAPGSSNEVLARIVGHKMAETFGQQVVVDTRPGASGIIGTELASKASPDGYTVLLVSQTVFATHLAMKRRLPFDPDKSFIPLTGVAWVSSVVALHPAAPATIAELVQLARSQPGRLNYGSAGSGSPAHIAGELFNLLAGTRITHVPYKGTSLAITDLVAGQIQLLITSPLVVLPHANIGRIKAIATTGAKRDPLLPQLPTVAETLPGYDWTQWWGLAAIAGTPRPIVEALHRVAVAAITNPEVKDKFAQQGATAIGNSPAEFAAFILRERARTADVVKRAGIAPED